MRPTLKNVTWLGASTAAIIIAGTVTALAQTAAAPTPQGCTGKTGTDLSQCQNELSNQQKDGTVGNGQVPNGGGADTAPSTNATSSGGAQNTSGGKASNQGNNSSGGSQNTASPGSNTNASGGSSNGGASSN